MKRSICLLLACVLACFCAGCKQEKEAPRAEETVFAMDTVMQLQVEGENAQQALEDKDGKREVGVINVDL